ncbi:MAG: thioredoxin-disulfide reductase [Bacteroidales bacterium]|nr:thioredoxin-disulfide reductase [Bacteroidales bacterium]
MTMIKCLIIGGGPAGCTAAIYAARAAMDPVVIEGPEPGGQLTTTTLVENYPGFKDGVDANELMFAMKAQAEKLGAKFMRGRVVGCDLKAKKFAMEDGTELEAQTVVVATGASAKYLGLPSEKKFRGMGVSACATCDGFFYRGRRVAVVGGGDTACEEAMYLSGLASEVHMIVRKPYLRASQASQARVFATPNITVHFETVTKEILGDDSGVTGARFEHNGEVFDIALDGFFLAIGRHPNTEWLGGQLETDADGYIVSDGVRTAVKGVFVAGDVRGTDFRQAITAAADGCRAALEAEKYLKNEI